MALFEFEFLPIENVQPWGDEQRPVLHWFALTDGRFWMKCGDDVLFRYGQQIREHWGTNGAQAEYQIAAFARDMLGCAMAALSPLPRAIEELARDREEMERLVEVSADDDAASSAWRWLGERTPWTPYLTYNPRLQLIRIGDEVRIRWDNRRLAVDGMPVWDSTYGEYALPCTEFQDECRSFAMRLLSGMDARILAIERGDAKPRAVVAGTELREQHEGWRKELEGYFAPYEPEVAWSEAESAIRNVARNAGRKLREA